MGSPIEDTINPRFLGSAHWIHCETLRIMRADALSGAHPETRSLVHWLSLRTI